MLIRTASPIARVLFHILTLTIVLGATGAFGYWDEGGIQISAVSSTARDPMAIADGEGGIVVVWRDQGGATPGIYAQRVDAEAELLWGSGGILLSGWVPSAATPQVIAVAGGFWFAWVDARAGDPRVYARFVTTLGAAQGPSGGSTIAAGGGVQNHVGLLPAEGLEFIAVWSQAAGTDHSLRAQRFDQHVLPQWGAGELVLSSVESRNPQLVPDGAGGAIVAWEQAAGTYWNAMAQRFDVNGLTAWGSGPVTAINMPMAEPGMRVSPISDGGLVIACEVAGSAIVGQKLDIDGSAHWNFGAGSFLGEYVFLGTSAQTPRFSPDVTVVGDSAIFTAIQHIHGIDDLVYGSVSILDEPFQRASAIRVSSAAEGVTRARTVPNATGGFITSWHQVNAQAAILAQSIDDGIAYWDTDTELTEQVFAGSVADGPEFVQELGGGSYAVWTRQNTSSDGVVVNRITRVANVLGQATYLPTSFKWWATVTFDAEAGHSNARAYHGPARCTDSAYSRVGTGLGTPSNPVVLSGPPSADPEQENTLLLATAMHHYKLVPGGMPTFADSFAVLPDYPSLITHSFEESFVEASGCSILAFVEADDSPACHTPGYCFTYSSADPYLEGHAEGDPIANVPHPQASLEERRLGARSMKFHMPGQLGGCIKQRAEFVPVAPIPFYQERWDAFSFLVPEEVDLPAKGAWMGIMQWFQHDDVSGDAMGLHLTASGDSLVLKVSWQDEDSLEYARGVDWVCGGSYFKDLISYVERDRWYDILMNYKFDPTGECGGKLRIWVDGDTTLANFPPPNDPEQPFKLGVPEVFITCESPPDTLNTMDEQIRMQKFGIYRESQNTDFAIYFDAMRFGTTRQAVEVSRVLISGDEITNLTQNSSTGLWEADLVFSTSIAVESTVRHGPAVDCDGGFAEMAVVSTPSGQTHSAHLTAIELSPADTHHVYRIEAADSSGKLAYVDGRITVGAPFNISHMFDESRCTVSVQWQAPFGSTGHQLYHRTFGAQNWSTAPAIGVECTQMEQLSGSYSQTQRSEFKVACVIDGVAVESPVFANAINCSRGGRPQQQVAQEIAAIPRSYVKAHPNPFNPSTTIQYAIASSAEVRINIYSVDGRLVKGLVSERMPAGDYSIVWDGTTNSGGQVSSGVYVVRMVAGGDVFRSKLVMLK